MSNKQTRTIECHYYIGELRLVKSRAGYLNNAVRNAMGWCVGGNVARVELWQVDGPMIAEVTPFGVTFSTAPVKVGHVKDCGPDMQKALAKAA